MSDGRRGGEAELSIAALRDALAGAGTLEEQRSALRLLGKALARRGEWPEAVAAMRRLRRLGALGPLDHLRLFRSMAAAGGGRVIARYVQHLRRAGPPTSLAGWRRAALAFCSEQCPAELQRLAFHHPLGNARALLFLRELAAAMERAAEPGPAIVALRAAHALAPGDAGIAEAIAALDRPPPVATDDAAAELASLPEGRIVRELSQVLETLRRISRFGPVEAAERRLDQVLLHRPRLRHQFARYLLDTYRPEAALPMAEALPAEALGASDWLGWAEAAEAAGDNIRLRDFVSRAVARGGASVAGRAAPLMVRAGMTDAAIALAEAAEIAGLPKARIANDLTGILDRLRAARRHGPVDLAERRVEETVASRPRLAPALATYLLETERAEAAFALLGGLSPDMLASAEWLHWAGAAEKAGDVGHARDFAVRAAARGGAFAKEQASALLIRAGMADEAVALWSGGQGLRDVLGRLRTLRRLERTATMVEEGLAAVARALPADRLGLADQQALIRIVRLLLKASYIPQALETLMRNVATLDSLSGDDAVSLWAQATLTDLMQDDVRAAALLASAESRPVDPALPLSIRHEVALLHLRYHRPGAARRSLAALAPLPPPAKAFYARALALLDALDQLVPDGELYPECLIDIVMDHVARAPHPLLATGKTLVTVTASLAHGGGERQTVTTIRALAEADPAIAQTLAARETEGKHGFFAPAIAGLPIDLVVYGSDWRRRTELERIDGLIEADPRVLAAIDLLPHLVREDVLRLMVQFAARRPAVVHVRQDLYAAAIAAALMRVPVFFVHRGSLSRDTWSLTALERERVTRPTRATYRRLFETTDFFVVNNSGIGRQSDLDWLEPPSGERVKVVRNAVDFDVLGWKEGPNPAVRDALGIPRDAPVIGAMFRVEAVKRPLLWVEIAAAVLRDLPDAHFMICGAGRMRDAVAAHADRLGLAGRLHWPGVVDAVGDWYRAMDVFLLTSEREGLPNVLIEAQHFGVPVVSADVGGARETMLPGVTGYLVDPSAPAGAFAERIVAVLTDADWRSRAQTQARPFVNGAFGKAQAVARLRTLYGFA